MSDGSVLAFEAWQAPELLGHKEPVLDAAAIEAIRQGAFDQGFAKGLAAGEAEGLARTQERADQFLALLENIDQPLREMDAHLAGELANLAALVAGELARTAITTDPALLLGHLQRISEALPSLQHPPKIFLHPLDREMIVAYINELPEEHPAKGWALLDEPSLDRGDCRLQGRDSTLNADLTQLAKEMVKRALNGEPA